MGLTSPPPVLPRSSDTERKSGCPRRRTRSRKSLQRAAGTRGLTASAPSVLATASLSSSEHPKISRRFAPSARVERLSTITPRCHAVGYPAEWQVLRPRVGERAEQDLPVIPGDDAAVEEYDRAVVGLGADEPAEALAKPKRGLRQLKLQEGVVVALGPPLHERIVGHAEGQPRDHDATEDVAR